MDVSILKKMKTFGGDTLFCEHDSSSTKTKMKFSAFKPNAKKIDSAIIWLSGLTCNEENFITKSGIQYALKDTSTMVICPDTSPRGLDLPGEHDDYDFGSGAGFYINATTEGYSDHYNMYDYVSIELVDILKDLFKVSKISIMGHSMGGHGALILALREKNLFSSVSAFSPIVNPIECPWGQKAFNGYLGSDLDVAKSFDATELVKAGKTIKTPILIEQGTKDEFLEKELLTQNFIDACHEAGQEIEVNYQEGYDHSYYFISTFIEDHLDFHLEYLT